MKIGSTAVVAAVTMALFRTRRIVVNGNSMLPGLFPGDRVVVIPTGRVRPGDVVAVRHPAAPEGPERLLIKRVAAVDEPKGTVTVVGDNPAASTDSRDFGPVARRAIVGRAVYRYAPAGREGLLRRILPIDDYGSAVTDTIDSDA